MKDKSAISTNKTFELSNFDIVLINYVEESRKAELFMELKDLYGDQEPIDTGAHSFTDDSMHISPDMILGKSVKFYYDDMKLNKRLPDKFSSLQVSVVNHISSWYEVICKARLKEKCLVVAKQQFEEELRKTNTLSTPKIIQEAHQEIEGYLSPYVGENVMFNQTTLMRKYYPYMYLGIVGRLISQKLSDIINETDYTRSAIGWGIGIASVIGRGYLLQRIGGRLIHQATTYDIIGFSILQTFQIAKGTDPASWSEDTRRRFARLSPEYDIVDTISLMILPSVVSNYRLERIKQLQNETGSLSHSIREQSEILSGNDSDGGTKNVAGLHIEMARLRSKFLGEIVDLRNEFDRLDDVLRFSSDYLLSKDADNNPLEKAFVHPPEATDHVMKYSLKDFTQINGVLSKFVQDSKSIKQEAVNTLNKVEEEQTTIVSHINGLLNINLQKRLENLTRNISRYTKWLIILTVLLIILAAASICVMVWQPFT